MRKIRVSILSIAVALLGIMSINAQENKDKKEVFKPSMKIEGRIMYDFDFLSAGDNYNFAGNEFRRLRLAAKGKVTKNVSYKADFDFTNGKIAYRDVYIKLTAPGNIGNVTIGSFAEPTGLDMLTSSKYITFIERAMMTTTQYGKYNTGFRYENQKLFDGKIGLQLAYTFNGSPSSAYKDLDLNGGANFIGRVTGKILENKEKKQLIHLGVNYEFRNDEKDDFGYKFRTENHMGNKTSIASTGALKNTSDIGFELAATFGPLSLQSEYELASIVSSVDTYKTSGYYGYVSYFITGENRPYKNSVFNRVKPKTDFCLKDKTWGAIELVARYSVMDLNDNLDVDGNDNKNYKISNITAGFNWHLNKNTRIMYNFTSGNHEDLAPVEYEDDNLIGHLIRFQVDF